MITTHRLVLRPLGPDDIPAATAAAVESLPELVPWMGWAHPAYNEDDVEGWMSYSREMWSLGREFVFGVFAGNRYLGSCGVDRVDRTSQSANLGYWLRTSEVGNGYASEAARAVAEWAFRAHRLVRIDVVVIVGNVRSERTAERIGAVREGIARNRVTVNGVPRDATVFGLIPVDLGVTLDL